MKTLLRRLLFILLGLAGLTALIYAEEDWRGRRAWDNCKAKLEAKGVVLDWDKYIPPAVPDDQNFFKAPKMTEWFVKGVVQTNGVISFQTTNKWSGLATNRLTTAVITNATVAANYLKWSDQFQPDFDLMREALKRSCARMDGDYSKPYEQPIPNFINVRGIAQLLAQRAKCDLLLGQPDKALQELTLLHDMCCLLEAAPTGKPMTLVAAMINVAVTGLYVDTLGGGLQSHAWQEPQLAVLQNQLAEIKLTSPVVESFQEGPARMCRIIQTLPSYRIFNFGSNPKAMSNVGWWFWPRGWTYQNMVNVALLERKPLEGFDLAHDTVAPRKFDEATREVQRFVNHGKFPYKILAAIAIPNFIKAEQTTAHNQTMVNEAQIACALERYRLTNGTYPETLDALMPQFIEKLPHDIIGGAPLIYRPKADGKFLLYSIGWNETDDGGQQETPQTKNGAVDFTKGDWVWKN
jgi:hypothetical protein